MQPKLTATTASQDARRAVSWRHLAIVLLGLAWLSGAIAATGDGALPGTWVLNDALSDDAEEAFEGKLRRLRYPVPQIGSGPGAMKSTSERAQEQYWETVRMGKERRSAKDLRRLGTAYPLVKTATLEIRPAADGYDIVYDEELPREVRPNPAGRVFTASGAELVVDTLGHTLSYWDGEVLVLETDPPGGGKVIERLQLEPASARLTYTVKVDLRVLKEPVELERVFERAPVDSTQR